MNLKVNLEWKAMLFARGETAFFEDQKLEIIRHKGNIWHSYVGNKKLENSKSKKEAVTRILEEINIQGKLF